MVWLDRLGWPVTTIKGHPVTNVLRILLHAHVWNTLTKQKQWRDYQAEQKKYTDPNVTTSNNEQQK